MHAASRALLPPLPPPAYSAVLVPVPRPPPLLPLSDAACAVASQRLSFSSYPGELFSDDDLYITDAGLIVTETTNHNFNQSLLDLVSARAVLSWQRVRVGGWTGGLTGVWGRSARSAQDGAESAWARPPPPRASPAMCCLCETGRFRTAAWPCAPGLYIVCRLMLYPLPPPCPFPVARAANMAATSGRDWVKIFSQHNSGTYNNQYMIVDTNRFVPK